MMPPMPLEPLRNLQAACPWRYAWFVYAVAALLSGNLPAQQGAPDLKKTAADVGLPPAPSPASPQSAPTVPPPPPAASGEPAAASQQIPVPFPASRYSALLEKSLFALATAAPEPVAPVENFATNWFLSSFSKSRAKDGVEVYTVFVKSRDLSTRLMLVGEKPEEGVTLVAVEEAPNRADTVAVIRKGTEIGRVKFDQAAFAAAPPAPVAPPRPGVPGAPGTVQTIRSTVPTASKTSIPRPGMSSSSRSGAPPGVPSAVPPPPAPPSGIPSGSDSRRRVRPIESAPAAPQ
jgi:hypothetical protein